MNKYINFKILGITIIVTFIFLVTKIYQINKETAIGVIGGADGPTAFFVTNSENTTSIIAFIFAVILFVVITLVAKFTRKQ